MNPIEKFNALPTKTKIAVGVGAVAVGGYLVYRHNAASQMAGEDDSTTGTADGLSGQEDTSQPVYADPDLDPTSGGSYGGGGGFQGSYIGTPTASIPADAVATPDAGAREVSDGTVPSPVTNNIYVGAGDADASGATGGGAPVTPHPAESHIVYDRNVRYKVDNLTGKKTIAPTEAHPLTAKPAAKKSTPAAKKAAKKPAAKKSPVKTKKKVGRH